MTKDAMRDAPLDRRYKYLADTVRTTLHQVRAGGWGAAEVMRSALTEALLALGEPLQSRADTEIDGAT